MRFLIPMVTCVCLVAVGCSGDADVDSEPTVTTASAESPSEQIEPATSTTSVQPMSVEPDGVLAEDVFADPSDDFFYVLFTDQQVRALRNDFFGGDSDTVLFLRDFTARKVQREGGPENLIIVYVVDPVAARDTAWQQSLQDGFTQGAESSLVVIGTQSLIEVQDDTGVHLLWQVENVVMMFHGLDEAELYSATRAVMEPIAGPFPTTTTTSTTAATTLPEVATTEVEG